MRKHFFLKVIVCAFSFCTALYAYLQQQNDLTILRIELPTLTDEVRLLQEENMRLSLIIDQFENPKHLMQLAKRPEFSHLKHPIFDEIIVLDEKIQIPQELFFEEKTKAKSLFGLPSVVIGAR